MEIKASCTYDYAAVKALTHSTIYKKNNPKKRFIVTTFFLLIVVALSILNLIFPETPGDGGETAIFTTALVVSALCTVISILGYFVGPKIQYKNMHNMAGIENTYIFTEKDFSINSNNSVYDGSAVMKYSVIFKIVETSKYMFIYRDKAQSFIVDKSTFDEGGAETVRNMLKNYLGNNYIICNY